MGFQLTKKTNLKNGSEKNWGAKQIEFEVFSLNHFSLIFKSKLLLTIK